MPIDKITWIPLVHGEFLFMRSLGCRTIRDHVPAKQNGSGWQVAAGLFPPLRKEFVDAGPNKFENHCNTL
jgi:hypothetical protein